MVFAAQSEIKRARCRRFQSLVGVYGFCGVAATSVSLLVIVSIPSRGLWFLRLKGGSPFSAVRLFQSLVGVYGFCGQNASASNCQI